MAVSTGPPLGPHAHGCSLSAFVQSSLSQCNLLHHTNSHGLLQFEHRGYSRGYRQRLAEEAWAGSWGDKYNIWVYGYENATVNPGFVELMLTSTFCISIPGVWTRQLAEGLGGQGRRGRGGARIPVHRRFLSRLPDSHACRACWPSVSGLPRPARQAPTDLAPTPCCCRPGLDVQV